MSIEALIQAHTEALLDNTEAVKLLTLSLAGRTPAKSEDKPKAEKAENAPAKVETVVNVEEGIDATVEAANAKQAAEMAEHSAEVAASKKPVKGDADIPSGVPYETVRALVLKLAPTQRDAIKALNVKHGIANLKVLLDKEDDFSTVNDQLKLEAVYADLQALEA